MTAATRNTLIRYAPGGDLTPDANTADDRCFGATLNTETRARDGHIVRSSGLDTSAFMSTGGPVLLAHKSDELPVARVTSIYPRGTDLRAVIKFPPVGVSELADTTHGLIRAGFLRGTSIGWQPIESRSLPDGMGRDFTKSELLELSVVPVPANVEALLDERRSLNLRPFRDFVIRAADGADNPYREECRMLARALAPKQYKGVALPASPRSTVPASLSSPRWRNLGEFAKAVVECADGREPDARLLRAPTGLSGVDPSAGGFLVPPQFVDGLVASIYDEESVIAPWCTRIRLDKPEASLPAIDEKSRATGSRWGGVNTYWENEGDATTATLPKFRSVKFTGHKLIGLCVATSELMADASVFGEYLNRALSADMGFRLDGAIVSGTGAGVPLGLMSSPALLTTAKDSGQPSGTITATNIDNMWSALPVASRRRAVWLCHEKAEAQISEANLVAGSTSSAGMYFPQGGPAGNPWPLVKGRPLIAIEQASVIGAPGDLILFDPTAYAIAAMDPRFEMSAHVDFASDQVVLRLVWRIDGKPLFVSAVTSYSDSTLRSPYVALAQR